MLSCETSLRLSLCSVNVCSRVLATLDEVSSERQSNPLVFCPGRWSVRLAVGAVVVVTIVVVAVFPVAVVVFVPAVQAIRVVMPVTAMVTASAGLGFASDPEFGALALVS